MGVACFHIHRWSLHSFLICCTELFLGNCLFFFNGQYFSKRFRFALKFCSFPQVLSSCREQMPLTNALSFHLVVPGSLQLSLVQPTPRHFCLLTCSPAALGSTSFPHSLRVPFQGLSGGVCAMFSESVADPTPPSPSNLQLSGIPVCSFPHVCTASLVSPADVQYSPVAGAYERLHPGFFGGVLLFSMSELRMHILVLTGMYFELQILLSVFNIAFALLILLWPLSLWW